MAYFKTFILMFSIVCLFIFTGYALGGETIAYSIVNGNPE